jgi:Domain of Unknown Function (DUF1080)
MTRTRSLLTPSLVGWRMAGAGGFRWTDADGGRGGGALESFGGSGLLWYAEAAFADLVLEVEWRVTGPEDNSGVFLRCPPLLSDQDIRPAVERGCEVQIDERGFDPQTGRLDSPLHLTGAIYRLAPATGRASRPIGDWNLFEITARGTDISVRLNGAGVSRLEGGTRETSGHVALQAHHAGSAVQFRRVAVTPLP